MGRPIPSKMIESGYHFDQGSYRDNQYVRCSRCGFICNNDRDLRSHPGGYEGWGTSNPATSVTGYDPQHPFNVVTWNSSQPWDGANSWDSPAAPVENRFDTVVNAGCPQCGTMLFNNPATGTRG